MKRTTITRREVIDQRPNLLEERELTAQKNDGMSEIKLLLSRDSLSIFGPKASMWLKLSLESGGKQSPHGE